MVVKTDCFAAATVPRISAITDAYTTDIGYNGPVYKNIGYNGHVYNGYRLKRKYFQSQSSRIMENCIAYIQDIAYNG